MPSSDPAKRREQQQRRREQQKRRDSLFRKLRLVIKVAGRLAVLLKAMRATVSHAALTNDYQVCLCVLRALCVCVCAVLCCAVRACVPACVRACVNQSINIDI